MKTLIFALAILFVFPMAVAFADEYPPAFCPGDSVVWICHYPGGHHKITAEAAVDPAATCPPGSEKMLVGLKACLKGHRATSCGLLDVELDCYDFADVMSSYQPVVLADECAYDSTGALITTFAQCCATFPDDPSCP